MRLVPNVPDGELKGQTRTNRVAWPGTQITRANIDAFQYQRFVNGQPPLNYREVTEAFINDPQPRHYGRTVRLMEGRKAVAS